MDSLVRGVRAGLYHRSSERAASAPLVRSRHVAIHRFIPSETTALRLDAFDSLWFCLSWTILLDLPHSLGMNESLPERALSPLLPAFIPCRWGSWKERNHSNLLNSFYKQSIYFIYKANAVYCTFFISNLFLFRFQPPKNADAKNMRLLHNAERAHSDLTLIVLLHCFKVLLLRQVLVVVVFFGEKRSVAILLGR